MFVAMLALPLLGAVFFHLYVGADGGALRNYAAIPFVRGGLAWIPISLLLMLFRFVLPEQYGVLSLYLYVSAVELFVSAVCLAGFFFLFSRSSLREDVTNQIQEAAYYVAGYSSVDLVIRFASIEHTPEAFHVFIRPIMALWLVVSVPVIISTFWDGDLRSRILLGGVTLGGSFVLGLPMLLFVGSRYALFIPAMIVGSAVLFTTLAVTLHTALGISNDLCDLVNEYIMGGRLSSGLPGRGSSSLVGSIYRSRRNKKA